MPISSSIQTTINDPRKNSYYFVSLDELVGYFQSQPGLITNLAHSTLEDEEKLDPKTQQHSQLVVTADFKGGYYEDPFTRTYSFEWLGSVDIFVYHTRILGTLIFENDSFDDLQYLLAGPQLSASTQTDPATKYYTSLNNTPLSTYFADRLIDLAIHHQFHGWLINIEIDVLKALQSYSRARLCVFAIKIWLEYLRKQGQIRVGPQWEVSWYDSVSYYDGSLSWQSQLRPQHNLNFFSAASSIFLDYHWSAGHLMFTQRFIDQFFALHRSPDSYPQETLERLDQSFEHSMDLKVETHQLRRSVLFGVDVFGRGCPYGGGFSSWKAALDILNASFSVALFAPGWTWESDVLQQERASLEESGPEWWKLWWRDERYSWVGLLEDPAQNHDEGGKSSDQKLLSLEPPNAYVDSLRIARENKQDEPKKGAGFSELPQHKPLMELFPVRHKSRSASFYTNWSLGSGHGIWVAGQHHFDPSYGIGDWSDMAMSFPKHDLSIRGGSVWSISGGAIVPTGVARCELVEHVGWFGSGCVEIKEQANGQPSSGAVKCLWMNTTSVVCSSEMDCRLVWKPIDPTGASTAPLGVVFQASDPSSQTKTSDPTISGNYSDASARPHMVTLSPGQAVLETHNVQTHELENGWYESTCQLKTQTSSSAMIDRLGITTIAGTRFAHYVGEISLAQSDHASPKPHNAPDSPLRVIWRPDATQQPMQIASPASRRLINKRGKVEWKYPGPSGPASNNHDRQTLLAWLIYLSKDASSASRCVNRKQAGAQRLVGVVKGFQEFDLNAFNAPPIDSDQTNDGNKAEEWNIIIKGIGSHGSIVCSGFCSLG